MFWTWDGATSPEESKMAQIMWVDSDGNDRTTTVEADELEEAMAWIEESGGWVDHYNVVR